MKEREARGGKVPGRAIDGTVTGFNSMFGFARKPHLERGQCTGVGRLLVYFWIVIKRTFVSRF
ncbi:hypothetical protein QWJ34_16655 [Saccharibacillus sp. CPCC 101409]|uniref:hypothetical protein n=1 Tax=Saccharibacillus sp. CPCC 101409 TaxID=3058041 RepID=UPI002674097A|nr:hypothetical protein [Saccharibacillus sp. CPCC 101409]MDO3411399.1 hypothetical protein [Saccharibacillus sp. CPCC 101409]